MSARGRTIVRSAAALALFGCPAVAFAEEPVVLPQTVARVWMKTPVKKLTGDLILTHDGIEFDSDKRRVFLAYDSVDVLTLGPLKGDVDTEWAVLRVIEDGLYRRYAIRDGRRLGYGTRTMELYELLRSVLSLKHAGQFRAAEGYVPFTLFDLQFATEYPGEWEITHRVLIEADGGRFYGTAVVAPDAVSPASTEIPPGAFLLHRRPAERDMTCAGFGKKGLQSLVDLLAELGHPGLDAEGWTAAPLGGCAGLRRQVAGHKPAVFHAATDGETLVVLELPVSSPPDASRRAPFEHAVSAFKFAWGY